jgi:hypothetical protein
MIGSCPRCNTPIEIATSGEFACPKCRLTFQAFPVRPTATPVVRRAAGIAPAFEGYSDPAVPATAPGAVGEAYAPERASPVGQARCATHANNHAVAACERCGDFMCGLCETPVQGRLYCPRCYDLLFQRGTVAVVTGRTSNSPTTTLVLGILSLVGVVCFPLNLGLSIAALILGVSALKQIKAQPDLPGRGITITGMALSALSVLGTILFFLWAFLDGMNS